MRGIARSIVLVLGVTSVSMVASAQQPPAPPKPGPAPRGGAAARPSEPPAVATVGALGVPRAELEAGLQQALADYRQRSGKEVPAEFRPIVERQVLESLIRRRLLLLEAGRQKLGGTDADAETELRRDPFFQENGRFSEAKFQAIKAQDPARWAASLQAIKSQLGAIKLGQRLEREQVASEESMRAQAEHDLQRANVSHLALRAAEFPGLYPEPREQDIIDYHRSHAEEFRRPARASLTVIFIDRPALPESLAKDAAAVRAWEDGLRPRADSVLAALRAGASIDSIGALLGGVRRDAVVTRQSFPGFWGGDARADATVFTTAVGRYLPEPVRARPGWLVARVEESTPEHVAPLSEVAKEIRARLRSDAQENGDERRLRAFYETQRDSLAGPAIRVRYAALDTGRVAIRDPSAADLDRFYRGHLADYSSFDRATGAVQAKSLAEVREDVRARWIRDQRLEVVRDAAERIHRAWSANKRDAAAERVATTLREVGPLPVEGRPDTGLAGAALGDLLRSQGAQRGAGIGTFARGRLVWSVIDVTSKVTPTFEQARPRLVEMLARRQESSDEGAAKELWAKDPQRFAGGDLLHVTRLLCPFPGPLDVPLTREEVERWHREHISDYAAGEQASARHILIEAENATPQTLESARQRALAVLARLRAGERFADLARQYSDDVATRENGGDLGTFGRGVMLDAFDRKVFSMRPGEVSEPVKTEVGWHIIECLDRLPADAEPLARIYTNVAADAARAKAERIALARADSLLARIHSVAEAKTVAQRTGLPTAQMVFVIGEKGLLPEEQAFRRSLEHLKPGQIAPTVQPMKGFGVGIMWVDSVTPAPRPAWEQARERALATYRGDAAQRTLTAKRAELDSMLRSGWTFDSLATLFGGLGTVDFARGGTIRGLGKPPADLDSLVFGVGRTPAPLQPGDVSRWLEFGSGSVRLRLNERIEPAPAEVDARLRSQRRAAVETSMREYFEGLKARFPVRILDPRLRDLTPPAPPSPGG